MPADLVKIDSPRSAWRLLSVLSALLACLLPAAACTDASGQAPQSTTGDPGRDDDDDGDADDGEDDDGDDGEGDRDDGEDDDGGELQFTDAKILIEHNASAEDTGFQAFVDGEPWNRLTISGPDDRPVMTVEGVGRLRGLGMTELFFETQEPANDEVPIEELLALFPAGTYELEGRSIDGEEVEAEATLSHTIPAGPEVTAPAEGSVVDRNNLVIEWNAVTETVTGSTELTIAGYELIVEEDAELPPLPGFARPNISIHVPASVTSLTIPPEFLAPGTAYKFEVLALEVGGNQTITEGTFETGE